MGDADAANPDDIFTIENYDNPAWGRTAGGSMDIACHYLYIVDNLLDASHVALVHVCSFAGAGTGNLPLDIEKLDDGVIVSRWVLDAAPPPMMHRSCPFPVTAITNSITNAACHRQRSTCRYIHAPARAAMTPICLTTPSSIFRIIS